MGCPLVPRRKRELLPVNLRTPNSAALLGVPVDVQADPQGVIRALVQLVVSLRSAASPPPPPAGPSTATAAPAPTITLRAQPDTIDRGGSTTLQWEARNATTVTIAPGRSS